jgi:cytochrome b
MACLLLVVLVLTTLTGLLTYGADGKGPLAFLPFSLVIIASANDDNQLSDERRDSRGGDQYDQKNLNDHGGAGERGHFWKEVHETLVGLLIFLASVHVCGVIASSYVHKENLILAMVTGDKKVG